MSQILRRVQELVLAGDFIISRHGYRELDADDIIAADILAHVGQAVLVEDYPDSRKEPSVLVLQRDSSGPVHVMWGVPRNTGRPAILVTAYRPKFSRWSSDFMKRIKP